MSRKIVLIFALTVLLLASGMRTGLTKEKPVSQQDILEISRKLEKVLLNQEKIFAELGEIKQELAIIKIRASR